MRFKQIIENSTTAGSVASVAKPMMTQTRENTNVRGLKPVQQVMKGAKKKGPYANSIVESKVTEDDLAEQDLIVIPGQGRLRRTGFVKHDLDKGEHEGETLKNSLHTIARAASELDKRLSVQSEFPEWVSEKIGAAKGMMVTVMDYLISSQEMQHDSDAMEGVAEGETSTPAIYVKGGGKYPGMTIAPKGWTRITDIKDEGDSYFVMVGNDGDGLNIPKDKVSPHQIKLKNGMPITAKQAFMMFNGWTPDGEQGVAEGSFGSGYGSVFTLYVNTGEKPATKTKTKKFKREDDAVLWAEDYADQHEMFPNLKMEIQDENGNVVWELEESQGVEEGSEDTVSFREMVDVVDKHYPKYYAELSGSNISDKQFEQKITSAYKKIMQKQGVAEGQLDELSRDTLNAYLRKSKNRADDFHAQGEKASMEPGRKAMAKGDKYFDKRDNVLSARRGARDRLKGVFHPKEAPYGAKKADDSDAMQGVAEGSVNDYFKRRKDEEDRIAGTKAPAKRTPKQTDYEKKRKEQGVAEGSIKDVEAKIRTHDQRKADREQAGDPYVAHEIHSHNVIRKQLLDKRKRAQAEYHKKMDSEGVAEGIDAAWDAAKAKVNEGAKVDRMVKHVKKSEKKLGHSDKEAENIAWATANKRGMLDNKNKKK